MMARTIGGVMPPLSALARSRNSRRHHVYIQFGLKSHGEGAHDYPQFSGDWSKLLTASERQVMADYLKRGGGLISIHDTLCGDDPQPTRA